MKSKKALLLSIFLTILIALLVSIFSEIDKPQPSAVKITRVIDGDTLVTETGETIRLVNINTPEKSEFGYGEAKEFLSTFENKSVEIEFLGPDKYGRSLARIYYPKYLNLELVERGFAKKFLVQESETKTFDSAENLAVQNSIGMWKHSEFFDCFEIEVFPKKETVTIKNNCNEINVLDWTIQDESRKKYKFNNTHITQLTLHSSSGIDNSNDIFWNLESDVWNNDRDTFYLFNEKGE